MIKKIFLLILSLFILWGAGGQAWAQTEELLTATVTTYSWDDDNKQLVKTQESKQCRPFGGQHEEDWLYLGEKDKTTWYYDGGESNIRYKVLVILGEVHLVL